MSKIFDSQSRNRESINLSDHVTFWLTFKESQQQTAFEEFKSSQASLYVFIGLHMVMCAYFLFSGWATYEYFPSHFSFAIFIISILTPALIGTIIISIRIYQHKTSYKSQYTKILSVLTKHLESIWLFGTSFVFSLSIVIIGQNGLCEPGIDDFEKTQGCNIGSENQMPEDMMMINIFIPVLFALMVKGAKWSYVVLAFLTSVFTVLFTMIYYDLMTSLPAFLYFIPVCMIVMYENQRQSISLFLLTQSQKNLLEENERLAAETHANELRHMIGNVAHDLKTVRTV